MYKLFLVISGVLILSTANAQQAKSVQKFSKAYNGLYILNDQIQKIFPLADIEYTTATITASLQNREFYRSAYIIVVNSFFPGTIDLIALKDYMKEGNHVFIFANDFNGATKDFYDFDTRFDFSDTFNKISLKTNKLDTLGYFESNRLKGFVNAFTINERRKATVLGVNENGSPNFIKINYGAGALFIHLYPETLLNYFLVEKNNYKYTEAALSYLPRNLNKLMVKLVRNESGIYDGEEKQSADFMSFIKNNPNLWTAFLLGLVLFGLLILFGFKKRQRIIPVKEPVKNSTLEFTKTIGDLYFNYKNNSDIAVKKIVFWQEHIRTRYQIPTHHMDKGFWEKLQKKSEADTDLLKRLENNIHLVKSGAGINDKTLTTLSNDIDQLNKI